MIMYKLTSLVVLFMVAVETSRSAPSEDLVTSLPGMARPPPWKQYSGYLNGTGDKKLHYWFLESANKPSEDPLVLWMNGGPGCSSVGGLLTEHGPFRVSKDGQTISASNQYSWNQVANMIYLEAPAGVGFSYSPDKNYTTNDDQVSLDNYNALQHFFMKFPEYKKNEFYVSGESYAGIYVPTLSARVVDNESINFKGFIVGNGISDYNMNTDTFMYFAYYHGLIGDSKWNNLWSLCCDGNCTSSRCTFSKNAMTLPKCQIELNAMQSYLGYESGLNEYNLYGPCKGEKGLYVDRVNNIVTFTYLNWQFSMDPVVLNHTKWLQTLADKKYNLRMTPPCLDFDNAVQYLNRDDVRRALHIPQSVRKWDICSTDVNLNYKTLYTTMRAQYLKVLSKNKRILVYNGDVDMACNFLGDEWFANSLGQKTLVDRKFWHYTDPTEGKQVAGTVKQMQALTLVTVRGAGHMVPMDKPAPAFILFTNFLQDKPYN